ncbi:MAG: efflux RND transporter periplasmic adaptor subunit [Pseudomonadales bacterium]|nr:efflux RND transporter periplasmic adaptor subunit [Pseudomonadales bacterium]
MSNIIKGLITVAVLFAAVVMAYGLVVTAPAPKQVEPEEVATAIRVMTINQETVRLTVRSQGTVTPLTESDLIPEVSGKVEWISPNLVAGGYFTENEKLLKIDDRDYRTAVDRGRAAVDRAGAEEQHARFELGRLQELVKKKLTSQSSLESAIRAERIASAARTEAELALKQAERDLLRTEIRAPYAGFVRSKRVDQGQFVSRGTPVASVYSGDAVEVRLPLADRQLAYLNLPLGHRGAIAPEQQADVTLSTNYGGQEYSWKGKLVRTEAEIDARSRMVNAVARVTRDDDHQGPFLPVGLFVNATIEGREIDNLVVLPRAALRNQNQVLVVDADNRLRYREVELLRFDKDEVYIQAGLKPGEKVNLSPIQTVIDGMRVKLVASGQS